MIKIREHELEIDVLDELQPYDWYRGRNRGTELTACSPFRNDSSPSFSINLDTGQWIDFGSVDEYWRKGNLVTLLSFLRNETNQEVEEYLIDKYGLDLVDIDTFTLDIQLETVAAPPKIISLEEYNKYAFKHSYLSGRGISEQVQRAFKCGYDKKSNAVTFAWTDIQGNIVNVKLRSVKSKIFFYYPDGQPIRNHFFGMYFIYKLNCKKAYLVESEIDALYLWTHGYPAIAIGGSNVSEAQKKLILRSPIETLVLATDNDKVGKEIRENVFRSVVGYKDIEEVVFPGDVKDVNDLTPDVLKTVCEETQFVGLN